MQHIETNRWYFYKLQLEYFQVLNYATNTHIQLLSEWYVIVKYTEFHFLKQKWNDFYQSTAKSTGVECWQAKIAISFHSTFIPCVMNYPTHGLYFFFGIVKLSTYYFVDTVLSFWEKFIFVIVIMPGVASIQAPRYGEYISRTKYFELFLENWLRIRQRMKARLHCSA